MMATEVTGRGGKRPRAGRPTDAERNARIALEGGLGGDRLNGRGDEQISAAASYDVAKAREMVAKAGLRELELEVERGKLVERVAVRAASATMQQLFVQAVRSLPDVLERTYGVAPDIVELVSNAIDEALSALAVDAETMCKMGEPE